MSKPVKPFTNSDVPSIAEFEKESGRIKHRAAAAKASEVAAATATPEPIIDPVTFEQREAPGVATAEPAAAEPVEADEVPLNERPVVEQLRHAVDKGQFGRLTTGPGQAQILLEQLTGTGPYARDGFQASAGVLFISRDVQALSLDLMLPGRSRVYERLSLAVATELDTPAGLNWIRLLLDNVRGTPATAALPVLLVILADSVPADTSLLRKLADEFTAGIALLSEGDTLDWTLIDA